MGLITQKATTKRVHVKSAMGLLHMAADQIKMAVEEGEVKPSDSFDRLQQDLHTILADLANEDHD